MANVANIIGREILDSRGNPTIEADVYLDDGSFGTAAVPSGASTGAWEALELRDGDTKRYLGKGVQKAVSAINKDINKAIKGLNGLNQLEIDQTMIDLDGTENKSRLGANAILGVSLAVAKAGAQSCGLPLYRYVGGTSASILPVPMMNIINGGAHADNSIDFQEFMVAPVGAPSFVEAVRMGSEVFHTLKKLLESRGHQTNVGDEGGFAPNLRSAEEALDAVVEAIETAGYRPGDDIAIVLDPAPTQFRVGDVYDYKGEGVKRSTEEHAQYIARLVERYPIISIEDPMAEDDRSGWKLLMGMIGDKCQLTGDDIYCTSVKRLVDGIVEGLSNSILVKVNQIGTLSEMLKTAEKAHKSGLTVVMSHRSGETEDTTISDLAVSINCGQIKTGSLSRSDRTAKYNRLIRIEQELGSQAKYLGCNVFHQFKRSAL